MPPPAGVVKDERPLNRKRSPSVFTKAWNFARNASGTGSRTPPLGSPSPSRSVSLQPGSPLLQPTTSAVTAPGSILRTTHHSPNLLPVDAQSFEDSSDWLASHITTLTSSQIVLHLAKLERVLRSPGHTRPPFTSIRPIILLTCNANVDSIVRQAGFSLVATYLESPVHFLPDPTEALDAGLIWHAIRSAHLGTKSTFLQSDDDWEQRLRLLTVLTSGGANIEGLPDVIPVLCTWQVDALDAFGDSRSLPPSEQWDSRIGLIRRASDVQRFLINVCRQNVVSITERDEECVIVAFLKALEVAVREGHTNANREAARPVPHHSPSRMTNIPSITRSASKHKRNSSSQSLGFHNLRHQTSAHPDDDSDISSWQFQAAAFIRLFAILSTHLPLPPEYVRPALESLLFILGSVARPLSPLGSTEPSRPPPRQLTEVAELAESDETVEALESTSWQLIFNLISSGYNITSTHEVRNNLLMPETLGPNETPQYSEARKAHGAARALRLSLRLGAQQRLALAMHRGEEIDEGAHVAYPLVLSSDSGWLRRLSGGSTGGHLSKDGKPLGIFGRAVQAWLGPAIMKADRGAESVMCECVGIAKDVIDECVLAERLVTDDEASIVGDILRESVQSFRTRQPITRERTPRSAISDTVSDLLYSIPLEMPITPSPYEIALSVADHIPDDKGVVVLEYIFKEVLTFPSASHWIPTIQEVFERFYRQEVPKCRRVIAQNVRSLYDDVRDLAMYRDPLVTAALAFWEDSLADEDDEETVADILAVLGDAIVAGAAEEQRREDPAPPVASAHSLDRRIVDLLVRVSANCVCADEARPSSSERIPLHRGQSAELVVDRSGSRWTPPSTVAPSRDVSMSPTVAYSHPLSGLTEALTTGDKPVTASVSPFVTHEKACKSMAAVLMLIETFNRLAFSPPHSLDAESPFKTARAPASSKCINVFEYLLSLLGPTNATSALPESESRKHGHRQASCRKARLAILQWSLRLRADRDHRLYFKEDLAGEVDPFAQLLMRGANDKPPAPPDTLVTPEVSADSRLGRTGRSLKRREPGLDRERRARSQTSSGGRSQSRFARAENILPPSELGSPALSSEQLWSLPDLLPFAAPPDGSRPSEGMTTFSDQREVSDVRPDLWLSVSTYVCILTDLMEDESDWEIFSYALCHIPLQLSNKHLFCGPRSRQSICNMVSVMTNAILSDRFGSKTRIPSHLRNTDVWGLACQTLTIFVGYRDAFRTRERLLGEGLVRAFTYGLNRHESVAKPCLQAIAICAYEFETATAKYLPQVLDHLVQVISKPGLSRQILELLAILGKMPSMYSNLRAGHFDLIFSTAGRYIQRHNRPSHVSLPPVNRAKVEIESFSLSQHVLVLAYYVVYIWYLGIERPERRRYIPTISRFLWIANSGQSGMDELTEVCFDWLKRYTAGDVMARPAQDSLLSKPEEHSRSWLLGNALMTIASLPQPGCAGVTVRGASGVVHLTIRVNNEVTQPFEEIDPVTFLPRDTLAESTTPTLENSPAEPPLSSDRLDPSFLPLHLSRYPAVGASEETSPELLMNNEELERAVRILDRTPVLELHKVGVMYAAPGQTTETEILSNRAGSPAYTNFLANLGHIIRLKGQRSVYPGGLDTSNDLDGEYAYVWWDEIAQIVFHATTMMPNFPHDPNRTFKKRHVGNDWVRIVWNDSGVPYRFNTLSTEFQLINVVIEPHSAGITAAYSNSPHENEFFKVTLQRAEGVPEFGPLGEFKLLSLRNLPSYVRQISLLASLFAQVYDFTKRDTRQEEYVTNWRQRLKLIKSLHKDDPKLKPNRVQPADETENSADFGDFTPFY